MKKINIFISLLYLVIHFSSFNLALAVESGDLKIKNDPFFKNQWYLKNTGQEGFTKTSDNQKRYYSGKIGFDIDWDQKIVEKKYNGEVIVAVVDSGVDVNHPDLKGRIWQNPKCRNKKIIEPRKPNNSKIKPKFCNGVNVLKRNGDVKDKAGHGTHIAGIIAANANGIGVRGMTSENIKIMPIKVWDPDDKKQKGFRYDLGKGRYAYITDLIAGGIYFAIQNGAKVINISSGWPSPFQTKRLKKVLQIAEKENVAIIAAAGNDNKEIPIFPCTAKSVICVGAVNRLGKVSLSSNYGGRVDLYAPGEDIVSLYPKSSCATMVNPLKPTEKEKVCLNDYVESRFLRITGYEQKSGTSFSAPIVAATVAMMKLQDPNISVDQIKARLFKSAINLNDKKQYASGMLSFQKAIAKPVTSYIKPSFKKLFSVRVENDKTFKFHFPIKNYANDLDDIHIKVSFEQKYVTLNKKQFTLRQLKAGTEYTIQINGKISNFEEDAFVKLKVEINSPKFNATFFNGLFLNRDFSKIADNTIFKIPIDNISNIFKKGSIVNTHRLKVITDETPEINQYYYKTKIDKDSISFNVLKFDYQKKTTEQLTLKLSKNQKIRTVYFHDVDNDGIKDYIIYGYNKKNARIYLDFYNDQLKPLFKNHYWSYSTADFPLTFFNEKKKIIEFNWVKIKTKDFGILNLPTRLMDYKLPKEDQSGDFLHDIALKSNGHLFFTMPKIEKDQSVTISWRALDDYKFIKKMINDFDIDRNDNMTIFASQKGKNKNSLVALMTVGQGTLNQIYKITRNDFTLNVELLYQKEMALSYNNWQQVEGNDIFMAIINRSLMRQFSIGDQSEKKLLKANNWKDPLVNYKLSTKTNGQLVSFVESRFHLYAFADNGTRFSLPVNRESSFANVAFSELIQPFKNTADPTFLIDSTTILGNQEYVMTYNEKSDQQKRFLRPIKNSFYFPTHCVRIEKIAVASHHDYINALCLDIEKGLILSSKMVK